MESTTEINQNQKPCNCQCPCLACQMSECHRCDGGKCGCRFHHWRHGRGCGRCPFCHAGRHQQCPYAKQVLEGYDSPSFLTFNRVMLILILILVIYIAFDHYKK
ncbi:hypothetical protein Indivirus_1_128 [Indivirus ILV1]|uniref:Uncharacterized protein n=1 Tax=Indivirus ILV1 TaxID=1977633 RepID=A0A1V0SCS1_9VIRU|nr:hypothetical protein Indivirus_1_128 [Indivirus ILV1]